MIYLWIDEEEEVGHSEQREQDESRSDGALDLQKVPSVMSKLIVGHKIKFMLVSHILLKYLWTCIRL